MLVFKAPQEQVLEALKIVAGVIDRHRRLPLLYINDFRRLIAPLAAPVSNCEDERPFLALSPSRASASKPNIPRSFTARVRRLVGFFSPAKVNARNTP